MSTVKLRGVHVATVTPFDREGGLSLQGLRSHLEFLCASGVHGLVPCGTTGESPVLSRDERRAVIQLTREVAARFGVTVTAGCGGNSTSAVLELIKEAEELGCDAALVVTPYYNKPTQAGLLAHFRHLADRTRLPIVLYNVPGRTAVALTPETSAKLMEHPRIVGIKEASGVHANWIELSNRLDLAQRSLLSGDDDAFATILALGGAGIISASANLIPTLFVSIHEHAEKKDWDSVFRLQRRIFPLVRALFAETNPAPLKFALHRTRGLENSLRLPLVPVAPATESLLVSALQALEAAGKA